MRGPPAKSEHEVRRYITDAMLEPEWRDRAFMCEKFYDGDQLDPGTIAKLKANKIPEIAINEIKPAIRAVLGNAIETMTVPRVVPRDDASYEAAEAFNALYQRELGLVGFADEVQETIKDALIAGIGWLQVSRNGEILGSRYRVERVPWQAVYWDWHSRRPENWRYVIRRSWIDTDELRARFPGAKPSADLSGWFGGGEFWPTGEGYGHQHALSSDVWQTFAGTRRRVAIFECWYKVWERGRAIKLPDGSSEEYSPSSALHQQMLAEGAIILTGPIARFRQAWYCGPHRLADVARPDHSEFPLYPLRCDSKASDADTPIGLVHDMVPISKVANKIWRTLLARMSQGGWFFDPTVLVHPESFDTDIAKIGALIEVRSELMRGNEFALKPIERPAADQMHFSMMGATHQAIRSAGGIHDAYQGHGGPQQSGTAIAQLIAQSSAAVRLPFWERSRMVKRAGRRLAAMLYSDTLRQPNVEVDLRDSRWSRRRSVRVNATGGLTGTESDRRPNTLHNMRVSVEVTEVRATDTVRQQRVLMLLEYAKSLPPEMAGALVPFILRNLDLPGVEEFLDRLYLETGQGPEPSDPEVRATVEERQAAEAEEQARQRDLATRAALADIAQTEARAQKIAGADTEHKAAETQETLASIRHQQWQQQLEAVVAKARLATEEGRALSLADMLQKRT